MFQSVLVANRGEIAVRIARTLQRMGIRAVVASSIADRSGLAARVADDVALLEGSRPADSYLDIDAVIAAAKASGCEAIHPGYGFLSESAAFAEACAREGIAFIGPPPTVLAGVGDKAAARQLAVRSGVPVVPGWDGDDDDATLMAQAERIGYPVMLKARGGGGGRGMREAGAADDLRAAIASARREADAAFGNPSLLLEKLVVRAHHVEVQIIADAHGACIHLGERDCSVQRRHQKLVEEAPSPVVDRELREQLTGAALGLARAIGYVNAGTFEFLVGEPGTDGRRPFYFLEVNPRLQVEHPVTEMVTGLDLVELQVRVAAGERLPITQEDVRFRGHAIECRINAEDPLHEFAPQAGHLTECSAPMGRFDAGFAAGDAVPPHYDSLLGKLVSWANDREGAIGASDANLAAVEIGPLRTTVALQRAILQSDEFHAGEASIDWLECALEKLLAASGAPGAWWVAAAAGFGCRPTPGQPFAGGRWPGAGASRIWLDDGASTRDFTVRQGVRGHGSVEHDSLEVPYRTTNGSIQAGGAMFSVTLRRGVAEVTDGVHAHRFRLVAPPPLPRRIAAAGDGSAVITAPLAGTVAHLAVRVGEEVEAGQVVAMLEAMKMEHRIVASAAGKVRAIHVVEGDVVSQGQPLVELT